MNEMERYMRKNVNMNSVKWRFSCTMIAIVLVA